MAYILSWPQFGHEKMPLPRTALFASWTHKFVHHRCESPCSTNRNKLSRHRPKELQGNSEKSVESMSHAGKHQYRGQHNSSRYSRNSLQTSASISPAALALALAYRLININHNKRPRPTGFWQCLPHSLPVWPGYVRMLCPLCPLFSATVSFLMDASQRSKSSSNSSSWLSI